MRLIRKFSWLCASSHPFECSSFLHPPLTTMTTFIPFLCKSFLHPPLITMTTVIPFLCKSFLRPPLIRTMTTVIPFLCKSFLHPPLIRTMTTVIPFLCKSFLHLPLITMTTFIIAFAHLGSALIFFLCLNANLYFSSHPKQWRHLYDLLSSCLTLALRFFSSGWMAISTLFLLERMARLTTIRNTTLATKNTSCRL